MNPADFHDILGNLAPSLRRAVFSQSVPQDELEAEVDKKTSESNPLAGTLCVFKDNFDVEGFPTDASSNFLIRKRPGPHADAALVRKAKDCGLIVAGKVHMNPFAYGLDGANPFYGDCPHPFLPGHCSGGSSSGSAWAVARGLVPVAFGTDTGGSIRVPAAYCGLYGFRMPPNEWATDGCFPLSPSYDSVGWFTHSARDMLRFSKALLDLPPPSGEPLRVASALTADSVFARTSERRLSGTFFPSTFDPEREGESCRESFIILQSREAYEIHKQWIDAEPEAYDPVTRERISRGASWTAEQIASAREREKEVTDTLHQLFEEADALILPVSPEPPAQAPMAPEKRNLLLRYTSPASLARLPVLTIPVISPKGPLGLQCLLPPDRWREVLVSLIS